jgi:hypothetical protein
LGVRLVTSKVSLTGAEKERIRLQALKILSHSSFRKSARSVKLFGRLVEGALSDDVESLKERILGHEVFGRATNYDTSADPIVRNSASEIRKRLAQYYDESRGEYEVRIEVVAGSYIPEFHFEEHHSLPDKTPKPAGQISLSHTDLDGVDAHASFPAISLPKSHLVPKVKTAWQWYAATATVLLLMLAGGVIHYRSRSALDSFWKPLLSSRSEVFISAGHGGAGRSDAAAATSQPVHRVLRPADSMALARITSLLDEKGKKYEIRLDEETKEDDLKGRSVVLIGSLNNVWSLRLLKDLRYRPMRDDVTGKYWISDSQHPDLRSWQISHEPDIGKRTIDYALITRVKDPESGETVIALGGLGLNGTEAAADFVTKTNYLAFLPKVMLNGDANAQIVLKTNVADGVTGPPEIRSTYSW